MGDRVSDILLEQTCDGNFLWDGGERRTHVLLAVVI